jgi:hypothetical protein
LRTDPDSYHGDQRSFCTQYQLDHACLPAGLFVSAFKQNLPTRPHASVHSRLPSPVHTQDPPTPLAPPSSRARVSRCDKHCSPAVHFLGPKYVVSPGLTSIRTTGHDKQLVTIWIHNYGFFGFSIFLLGSFNGSFISRLPLWQQRKFQLSTL